MTYILYPGRNFKRNSNSFRYRAHIWQVPYTSVYLATFLWWRQHKSRYCCSVFDQYFGGNTSDVSLWGLTTSKFTPCIPVFLHLCFSFCSWFLWVSHSFSRCSALLKTTSLRTKIVEDKLLKTMKIVLLGDTAVGKSCVVVRFVRNEYTEHQVIVMWSSGNSRGYWGGRRQEVVFSRAEVSYFTLARTRLL